MTRIVPVGAVRIIDGPGLILPDPPLRRPERISIGLFDRTGAPQSSSSAAAWVGEVIPVNYVKGMVANINWSELQPDAAGQTFDSTAVEDAITEAGDLGLQLKVRVFFGSNAPTWAKTIGGAAIAMVEPQSGNPFTVGRWWHEDYVEAVRLFWEQFASTYESSMGNDGPLREVAIGGAMTRYVEQDIRQNSDPGNRQALIDAGYTLDADLVSQEASIEAHLPLRCVSSRACNPYQVGDTLHNVASHTLNLMDHVRETLGLYGSLGNNSDRVEDGWPSTKFAQIYTRITESGAPSYIQTAASGRVGDLYETCHKAVSYGCTSIELPGSTSDYTSTNGWGMTPTQFDEINASLVENALAIGYAED